MPDIGLILLAAGSSSRMGTPKQLLDYGGKPLLRHAAEVGLASICRPVLAVLGSQAELIGKAIEDLPLEIVLNPRWEEGMGTSIHAGVEIAQARNLDGVILALADQPLVTAAILNRLVETHLETGQAIVSSQYAGTVGVPVFFARAFFANLLKLAPGQGCKGLIVAHEAQVMRLDCPEAEVDIDTPQEYARLHS